MNPSKLFIEPEEERSPLSYYFERAGLPALEAEWLVRVFYASGYLGINEEHNPTALFVKKFQQPNLFAEMLAQPCHLELEQLVEDERLFLTEHFPRIVGPAIKGRDSALLLIWIWIFDRIASSRPAIADAISGNEIGRSDWYREFLAPMSIQPINLPVAIEGLRELLPKFPHLTRFMRELIENLPKEKKAFWLAALDWSLLREPAQPTLDERLKDPRRLEFWFSLSDPDKTYKDLADKAFSNPEVSDFFVEQLRLESGEKGRVALNLAHALIDTLESSRWATIVPRYGFFYLSPLLDYLLQAGHIAEDEALARAIVRLMALADGRCAPPLPDDLQRLLITSAKRELGLSRPSLKKAASESFAPHSLNAPLAFLFHFAGPSAALEATLTMFIALEHPAVATDLRYWKEDGREDPPEPYRWISDRIAAVIHALKEEQERDPELIELRRALATFFLKRLKTHQDSQKTPSDDNFIEPRWLLRYAYVRAIRDLKVNPRGQGHHVLRWVSENDPHEEVREQAKAAYKELRHEVPLPSETSPRKPLFAAFWWLRQAHLLNLGQEVDAQGAQRTRSKEVTYTGRQ